VISTRIGAAISAVVRAVLSAVVNAVVRAAFGAVAAAVAAVVLVSACSTASGSTDSPGSHAAASSLTTQTALQGVSLAATARNQPSAAVRQAADRKITPVNHCAHNGYPQQVIVSIRHQHAWMCAHRKLVYSTAVTTGMLSASTKTPTGNYRIQARVRNTVLTLSTGATYAVKFWIPFDAPLYGFHDSSWQHFPYGSAKYKTHGSHGCIHLSLEAMRFLYRWSVRTTHVHIA